MTEENPEQEFEQLPPYVIEGARSSRSKCKTCRRKIDKGALRIGILIEGPFGTGYLWNHIKCAARRQFDKVEEAYELEAWKEAKEAPDGIPPLADLAKLREEAEQKKKERRELPYAQVAPSGRSKCKHCGEIIEKGSVRIVMGREVEFGRQIRTTPVNIHPRCVAAELFAEDCAHDPAEFLDSLRHNSSDIASLMGDVLAEIGPIEA